MLFEGENDIWVERGGMIFEGGRNDMGEWYFSGEHVFFGKIQKMIS